MFEVKLEDKLNDLFKNEFPFFWAIGQNKNWQFPYYDLWTEDTREDKVTVIDAEENVIQEMPKEEKPKMDIRGVCVALNYRFDENEALPIARKIIDWFHGDPSMEKIDPDLKNDLFFGCGFMLTEQIDLKILEENLKKYSSRYRLGEFGYYRQLEKAEKMDIRGVCNKDAAEEWKEKFRKKNKDAAEEQKKKLRKLMKEYRNGADAGPYIELERIKDLMHGKRNRYSKRSTAIAKYLRDQLAKSELSSNTRFQEDTGRWINNLAAVRMLKSLTTVFGVNLPHDLRKL